MGRKLENASFAVEKPTFKYACNMYILPCLTNCIVLCDSCPV